MKPTYDGVTDLIPQDLYYIHGITGEFYTTKLAAEVRARAAFPEESPDRRYARVFYKRFFEEV
tara:strand:+ start:285 stop:473 length:189 start_codon:yes stop_codon:yes gene_type:complete